MSTEAEVAPSDMIGAALDGLVDVIQTAGVAATRDPGDFQPPAAIVGAPSITGQATMAAIALSVPIYIVADGSGKVALDWMLAAVVILLPVLGESSAEPTLWTSPINPAGLSAYLIRVRVNIAQTT